MGLFDVIAGALGGKGKKTLASKDFKCPNCGAKVTLDMERCYKCGVRIKSMFRKKCPKCKELNELDAKVCGNCNYDFEAEVRAARKTQYRCPRCGYKMGVYMMKCPVCGVRFG
jgi:hypothetical protein